MAKEPEVVSKLLLLAKEVAKLDINYRLVSSKSDDIDETSIDELIRKQLHITLLELQSIRDSVEYKKAAKEARKERNRIIHDVLIGQAYNMCSDPLVPATLKIQLLIGTLNSTKVNDDRDDKTRDEAFVFNLVTVAEK